VTGFLLCPAGIDWKDDELVSYSFTIILLDEKISFRIKNQLRIGELIVRGDQWPLLVYRGHVYDPENPWLGLFRGVILVSVSFPSGCLLLPPQLLTSLPRLSSTYSRRLVLLRRSLRQRALVTLASTA
jgi:hypothetical protein